ncbi:MAG TPA: bifunctional homocysteine S-methyltransferase/methylenetetrahydrofolate reductase [Planctomycetota bacterium]|nr:bifunctional homocysteine S-methyltransferase/methylenetetrahydrofolate reductase [Planctomycetota bacterium]
MSAFLKALEERVLVADGAMGTQIYARGVPLGRCYDELNLTRPELIRAIHREYLEAGAEVIETNTFTANRLRLKRFGLEAKVREINAAGVRAAREAAGSAAFVAGSVGPLTGIRRADEPPVPPEEKADVFREQCEALAEGGCDALILETFTDLEELKIALAAARGTRLPVVCQMAFVEKSRTPLGVSAEQALRELEAAGADVIGANCTVPHRTFRTLERLCARTEARLSAFPNAGLPEYVDGRYMYLTTPEYFAEIGRKLRDLGVNLIGGCCGTGPEHVRSLARAIRGSRPAARARPVPAEARPAPAVVSEGPSAPAAFHERLGKDLLIVVELDPPRGLKVERVLRGARRLRRAGCDAITVGDNPLAIMRLGNVGMAHLLEREGIPTIVHVSCRDKNLIALQSTLLEAATLGITALLPVTGDPAKVGDQPQATSVYDLNSFDLIRLIAQMNAGRDYAGNDIGGRTRFSIGCAFNPNVRDLDLQVRRLRKKVAAGAQFALPQPLYDAERIPRVYDAVRRELGDFPVFFGVLPTVSARNAEFLAHEVPGISIPPDVLARMRGVPESRQREEGVRIAKELIERAIDRAPGFYIIPPFGAVDVAEELVGYIRDLARRRGRWSCGSPPGTA